MVHIIMSFIPEFSAQSSLPKDTVLYHTFPLDRFIEMVKTQKLYFRKVIKWADTYEYPIRFMPEDRKGWIKNALFGFCLTKTFDKEVMWKLYSDDNNYGICIKTTAEDICKALSGILRNSQSIKNNAFIGNVQYVPYLESQPSLMFKDDKRFEYPDYMYPAFLKRDTFAYEEEVRLILFDVDAYLQKADDGVSKSLLNTSFIHEIILSPYCPPEIQHQIEDLCKTHGILAPVRQSTFLKEIEENSFPLPDDEKIYWGVRGNYEIASL